MRQATQTLVEVFNWLPKNQIIPKYMTVSNHSRSKQQDEPEQELLAITCNLLKGWEKSCMQAGTLSGFGFALMLLIEKLAQEFSVNHWV